MTQHVEGRIRSRAKVKMYDSKVIANKVSAEIQSLTPKQVEIVLSMCMAEVFQMLCEGKRVSLLHFGQFRIEKVACGAHLPQVNYKKPIPVIKFAANRKLKQKLRAIDPEIQPKRSCPNWFRKKKKDVEE